MNNKAVQLLAEIFEDYNNEPVYRGKETWALFQEVQGYITELEAALQNIAANTDDMAAREAALKALKS